MAPLTLAGIITQVEEKLDGRSFGAAKHLAWADVVRKKVARDAYTGGFHGLYFLYKEATVRGGSIAGEARYAAPDDFVDDLNVWCDKKLLMKSPRGVMDITYGDASVAPSSSVVAPTWVRMAGVEFELLPPPQTAGLEIRLFYNGLPGGVTGTTFTDYFLNHYPSLHVAGMAELAARSLGQRGLSMDFKNDLKAETQALMLANRRWYLKGARIRFQNWDEFEERKTLVFPQFGNL